MLLCDEHRVKTCRLWVRSIKAAAGGVRLSVVLTIGIRVIMADVISRMLVIAQEVEWSV